MQHTPEQIVLSRVRAEMERHLRNSGAPVEVHEFLLRHWASLMTTIFMAKGNQDPDWQAGWDTVNALLWSLAPKQGRRETNQMLRLLPALLARLHEGCDALNLRRAERDRFFQLLSLLHAAVARQGLHAADPGGMTTQEASVAPEQDAALAGLKPQHAGATEAAPAHAERMVDRLRRGSRVWMRVGGEEREMVLSWLSPMGGMYLFTNAEGLEAVTLTRARLLARLSQGEMRLRE